MPKLRIPGSDAPPIFMNKQPVWDELKNKWGRVSEVNGTSFIGGGERRYYVEHSGFTWSVPEKYLDSAANKNK